MAHTSSAKKAQRVADRRAVFNARRKKTMKTSIKEVSKSIVSKKGSEAEKQLPSLYQAVDKAVKQGLIKKNAGARIKSRITKRIAVITK